MKVEQAVECFINGNRIIYERNIYDLSYVGYETLIISVNFEEHLTVPIGSCEPYETCLDDFPTYDKSRFNPYKDIENTFNTHEIEAWVAKYNHKLKEIARDK